jgi:hypothetical protein
MSLISVIHSPLFGRILTLPPDWQRDAARTRRQGCLRYVAQAVPAAGCGASQPRVAPGGFSISRQ